jgi:Domain of unknown function (DU1801)
MGGGRRMKSAPAVEWMVGPNCSKECALASKASGRKPTQRSASAPENVKWNAPSFRTSEYFATFHLRAKDGVQVILHLGAKTWDTAISGITIADPESLLEWLAKNRASVKFRDLKDIEVIRQWLEHV